MTAASRRLFAVASGAVVAAVGLLGCADATPVAPSAAPPAASERAETSLGALEHAHEVAFQGGELLLASHQGVYAVDLDSGALELVGGVQFDAMGMAVTDAGVLASGHPGAQVDDVFLAPNIGLISLERNDWTSVSLGGEVDFHALSASADGVSVAGLASGEMTVLTSADGGETWQRGAQLDARDLTLTPDGLVATTADGLMRSDDGGETFAAVEGAPLLVLVAADGSALVGVDAAGAVVRSGTEGWQTLGRVEGTAAAVAVADDGMLAVVDDRGLVISSDDGQSWQVLLPAA